MIVALTNSFDSKWNHFVPNKAPIPCLFKHYFPNSWLRLHSLPNSKRYADHASEVDL